MKRKALLAISIILLLTPLLNARNATASIQRFAWINATLGEDAYYGRTVIAYKAATTWNISISVYNDYFYLTPPPPQRVYLPVNITAIKVYFDWGAWYNHTFKTPVHMKPQEVMVFNIGNLTPTISAVPETWVYSYTVHVEYVAETDPSPKNWTWSGSNFAIMSEAHFNSFLLYNKLKGIMTGITVLPPSLINLTEAQVLLVRAYLEYTLGLQYYRNGAFEDARVHLQSADVYFADALNAWSERGTAFEDAMLEYYNALASAAEKNADAELIQANAALNNAYGWIFFGIGWILIGVGIIVYGARKPKTT